MARKTARDSADDMDRMVRQPIKTCMDSRPSHHRADLADSIPDHSHQLRLRVRADVARQGRLAGGLALCHQFSDKPDFHADPVRNAELTTRCGRHLSRLGHNRVVDRGDLAALSLGEFGSDSVFGVGVAGDGAAAFHYVE